MLFKGTKKRTAYQIAQQIERIGGYINAFTEKELICFFCTLPYNHFALAIDILFDMMTASILDEREIEKEKLVVINEIQDLEDNPEEKAHELYLEQLWNSHALAGKITGGKDQIKNINCDKLMSFYRERYAASNTVVTAAGRIDPEKILEQLRQYPITASAQPFITGREPPVRAPSWEVRKDKFQQIQIYTGICFNPGGAIKEYYNELVFSTIFGESMSSRLFQHLREDKGLCYSIFTFRTYYSDTALWTIYANTVPESVPGLLSSLNDELAQLLLNPPDDREVEDAKSQLKGNLILVKEDMENRMKRLLRQYVLYDRVLEHEESIRLLDEVTREDVGNVIESMIKPDNFNLLAYGSRKLKRLKQTKYSF